MSQGNSRPAAEAPSAPVGLPDPAAVRVPSWLQWAQHVLMVGLAMVVALTARRTPVTVLVVVFVVVYLAAVIGHDQWVRGRPAAPDAESAQAGHRWPAWLWLGLLSVLWLAMLAIEPRASFIAFGLFFVQLHLVPTPWSTLLVVLTALCCAASFTLAQGFTAGAVIGPLVGAGVALALGYGYSVMSAQALARERLLTELVTTRGQLAASERTAGIHAERTRLARELHDTVAQDLSSIQLLLHAAERADPSSPAIEHLTAARQTAADALSETRTFIAELSPAPLRDGGLRAALSRLASTTTPGPTIDLIWHQDLPELPMGHQTALLRIAQGAIANVRQHAQATQVRVEVSAPPGQVQLLIADDGRGFDPATIARRVQAGGTSFGLRATAERIDQLGGHFTVDSAPGEGTRLTASLPLAATPDLERTRDG